MSLRVEWEQEGETPQLLELALEDRFKAAKELLARGEWDAAIYLFGYVAEMTLKVAYFLYIGNRSTDSVVAMLAPARSEGVRLTLGIDHESYHSLRFWSELLQATRQEDNLALPSGIGADLVRHVAVLYSNWKVDMRYHPNRATQAQAQKVADAAEWLFNNRVALRK